MTKTDFKQIIFTIFLSLVSLFAYTNVTEAVHIHTYSAATCSSPKKCTSCGATSGSALGHNYVTSGNTVRCTRCGATKTVGNSSGGGSTHVHTYSAATCTSPKKCTSCGATSGSALGHNYTVTSTSAASCTTDGKTVSTCSRCGNQQTTTTSALGHSYTTTTTPATCTSAGKTVKKCSKCGDTQTSIIVALGHDYYMTTNISATCTTSGKVVKTCSRCNDTQQTYLEALGHDFEVTTNIAPTCTTKGKKIKTCSRCKETEITEIPALEHDFKITNTTATCTVAGKIVKKCQVCGYEITETEKPLGHDYKENSRKDPTCTENGKITYTCTRCGATETTEKSALGHIEGIVFNTTHHWYECDRCGLEISNHELHDFDDNNTCRVCGYQKGNTSVDPDEPIKPTTPDGDLIIEPWMKENSELNCLAVSLRSEPYEEDRANKNIYALDEKVVYYVDYKNGGKKITQDVKLVLELPLAFSVVDADGASVSKSKKTFTWTFDGLEKGECGTKVVMIRYTSLGSSSVTYKKITPKATISVANSKKDISAVLNLVVKDLDTEIKDTHYPYMYGDEDTGTFRPDAIIKRGEGALVFTRIFGISTKYDSNTYAFPDLDETYLEARRAVMAATAYGIIEGYPDGTYKPNKAMTRGEFITILARQMEEEYGEGFEIKDENELIKVYKDKNRIYYISDNEYYDAHWSVAYATLLARLNMTPLKENDTNLRVDDPITRAEVAQLVNFYLLRAPAKVTSSSKTQFPDVSRRHELFADIIEATRKSHNYSITEDAEEVAK